MEEKRKAKIQFGKAGNGYDNPRISLPINWIKKLEFTKEERNAIIYLKNNSIIIKKEKKEKEEES